MKLNTWEQSDFDGGCLFQVASLFQISPINTWFINENKPVKFILRYFFCPCIIFIHDENNVNPSSNKGNVLQTAHNRTNEEFALIEKTPRYKNMKTRTEQI